MDALEQTALAVLSALRVIQDTKFQNLRVAVIGGAASQGSTTIPRYVTPRQVVRRLLLHWLAKADCVSRMSTLLLTRPTWATRRD
jgi:hypothetical protein